MGLLCCIPGWIMFVGALSVGWVFNSTGGAILLMVLLSFYVI